MVDREHDPTAHERVADDVEAARFPPSAEWLFTELALMRARWDAASHPHYARWSSAALDASAMRMFVEEHDHLVVALATVATRAAGKADGLLGEILANHVQVADARVSQWRELAKDVGWGPRDSWHYASEPLPQTVSCVELWLGAEPRRLALDLITLVAAEPEPDADVRAGLAGVLPHEDPFAMLAHAEAVHRGHWDVLDALEGVRYP